MRHMSFGFSFLLNRNVLPNLHELIQSTQQ
jgi:hypothetical protein